jgi:hypothetical protein
VWTDYTTVGYSLLLKHNKVIRLEDDRVTILDGKTFGCINIEVRPAPSASQSIEVSMLRCALLHPRLLTRSHA